MPQEKKVNHLSIFLIKQQFTTTHQVIKIEACDAPAEGSVPEVRGDGHLQRPRPG